VNTDLVERARDGDVAAYEALARGMAPRLFRIAFRIVRDAEAAQDVMQQALIAMWRDLPGLRDAELFEAWACRLAVNAATSEIRRDRRRTGRIRLLRLTDDVDGREAVAPDASAGLVDRDEMERAFARLTPEQRAVLVLRHYVGMPLDEIATTLEIPYGTAASRLHYALRGLRSAIEASSRPPSQGVHSA
jgi:RNA polymerase sigma-70 factor (ECF subfamily)